MEKVNVRDFFSKGTEAPGNLLHIAKQICLLDEEIDSIIASHMKRVYAGEDSLEENEERMEKQTQLLHQIEGLLGLDTDYVDKNYKVCDSEVLREMAKYLPYCQGDRAEFFILPNGVILFHGFIGYHRIMFYKNLEKVSSIIISEVEWLKEREETPFEG
jgi:hypothetical protein